MNHQLNQKNHLRSSGVSLGSSGDLPGSSGRFRGAFRLLCWEGAFAVAYETWVGPIYLSGLAGEIGISIGVVTLLASLPWIGSMGQLVGTWAFERADSPKRYTLQLAAAARAVWVFPIFLAIWLGYRSHTTGVAFPATRWILAVAVTGCISSLLASSSGTAWNSWVRELVPERFRGRFFGTRQRYTMTALIAANGLAAAWVGWNPGGYRLGYLILGVLALIAAALSTFLLSRVPDAPMSAKPLLRAEAAGAARRHRTIAEIFGPPLRDPQFRLILLFGASFNGALQIAGPYFPYYFTKELQIPMSSVALWTMLINLGCVLAAGFWGKQIDRAWGARNSLWITGHIVALSPILYAFLSASAVRWVAPIEHFLNGLAWSGYLLATTALLFRSCPAEKSAAWFSIYAAGCGLAGAICTMLGGHLAQVLAPVGGFRALFVIATMMRLGVLWGLYRLVARSTIPNRSIAQPVAVAGS